MRRLILAAFLPLIFIGCNNAQECETGIVETDTGLRYEEIECGDGTEAARGDLVTVHYTGTLENGKKFDSSLDRNEPFEFRIGSGDVIAGWEEGVVGMREGGTRELTIPPDLGYGKSGFPPVIPPNSTLIFEIELLEVQT